ncbi:hypothetical protein ACHAW5_005410 [Stephanodiscus triporus]|uniref:Uncharacterized protein n=1 Tax=Stephanodiscus triporus TaxID=2934178 RepID=A0ABD3NRL4_9STRA
MFLSRASACRRILVPPGRSFVLLASLFFVLLRVGAFAPSPNACSCRARPRRAAARAVDLDRAREGDEDVGRGRASIGPAKPRLASALEISIGCVIRTLLVRSSDSFDLDVRASSNRNLLRGEVDGIAFSARNCILRFGILSLRRSDVAASNLRLGYLPLVLPLSPFLVWRLRSYLWPAALVACMMPSSRATLRSAWVRLLRALGTRPSRIDFSFTVSEDDINRSLALRFGLRAVLRSLVENSVVGAAAALADDVRSGREERDRRRGGGRGGILPLLPFGGVLDDGGRADDAKDAMALIIPKSDSQQRLGLASDLLSATKFDLKNASFDDGRIVLRAEATTPNEEGSVAAAGEKKRALPFTIRARLEPASSADAADRRPTLGGLPRRGYCDALGFASPDCRLNTNPLTAGTLIGRLIPDVLWIPFGSGVAFPFGRRCRIHRAEISPEKDGNDREVCRIDGSLTAFATEDDPQP